MGTLLPENLCVHRKGALEKLIKDRARDAAAQPQILFGKPTGDHDGPEELLVELFTSFTGSLFSHALIRSCEDCEVIQTPNRVRSPNGGESSKRPTAKDLKGCCKRRCTQEHDQGCQATEQVQYWIQEGPHMFRTDYFGHHTCRSYPLNDPQNPLLEAHHSSFTSETISSSEPNSQSVGFPSKTFSDSEPYSLGFPSKTSSDSEPYYLGFSPKTISNQDSEPHSLGFSSKRIATQYTSPCPSSASSVRKDCGVETVQSNSLSSDLPFLPSQRPEPMIPFSQVSLPSFSGDLPFLPSRRPQPMIAFSQGLDWIGQWLSVLPSISSAERRLRRQRLICGKTFQRPAIEYRKMREETC